MNTSRIILKRIQTTLVLVCMLSMLIACDKSEAVQETFVPKPDTLMPAYTDTGAEIIAFRVNGRMVISEDRVRLS